MTNVCLFPGCDKPLRKSNACSKSHYSWLRRHGRLPGQRRCTVPGCAAPHEAKGYCRQHYLERAQPSKGVCTIAGCGKTVQAKGLCPMHYVRLWEGRPLMDKVEQFIRDHPPGNEIGLVPVGDLVAIVDAVDYPRVIRHYWYVIRPKEGYPYAVTKIDNGETRLGQFILGVEGRRRVIYLDKDPLNCRRSNLRVATYTQMMGYCRVQRRPKTSKYRGVSFNAQRNKYEAYVGYHGRRFAVGFFHDEEEAARARDAKAQELFGEFAWLNFPNHA